MQTIEFTSADAGPFYAFPLSEAPSFANWNARKVLASGANGFFTASVDSTAYGSRWLIFSGASAPASWNDWTHEIDFASSLEGIPRYGETQRWDNGTETIDVLIEEAP